MGVLDNTIVFFTSDNGPTSEGHDVHFFNSSGSLKGHKRDTYEGGIRVPFMVNWYKKIKSNQVRDCIISGQDIMPTLAELANTKTPQQVTGTSFTPTLFSQNCIQRPYINWEFQSLRKSKKSFRQAIRFDSIKVVRYGIENPIEVYNLNQDPYEINNRVSSYSNYIDQFETIFKSERKESNHYPFGGLPILRK
jgi:arylsulfatase A-like enzyme